MIASPVKRAIGAWLCFAALACAQDGPISVDRPKVLIPIRPYTAPVVPPVRLVNSNRLYTLIRAGNLYLSVQDALALAIENNLNLEIERYGTLLADTAFDRAKAGGPLRGVPSASAQVSSVNSGVGVNGSALSAGVANNGGGGGGGGGGNATVQQIGAVTPNLDPVFQNNTIFTHKTQPQANTVLSQTNALIQSLHTYNSVVTQGTLTGGSFQFTSFQQYLKENSPSDNLNPAVGPHMDLQFRQNFLRGFGTQLNNRGIRIAKINTTAARESFRAQLLSTVSQVLNLYWDYATTRDELKIRERALAITQKFVDDTKYEISIGALAGFQLTRAEAEMATRRQDLAITQGNLRQRATLLKQALSHTEDPALEAAEIIPTDRIEVPDTEDLPPLRTLVTSAMAGRPDVAVTKFRQQTDEINLAGTTNPLLPSLQVNALTYNRGVAGTPQGGGANSYFIGGYGTALGQIFRRNFPNNQVTVSFFGNFGNRQAQADYGIDQLQFRQSQVRDQRDLNQIVVDISSQMAALRQARARYAAAKNTRVLQEQLLEVERKKSYGSETFTYIMVDQRALLAAQLSELNAIANYSRARISLDQVIGETLERNSITLDEGLNARINRESRIPDVPPANPPAGPAGSK